MNFQPWAPYLSAAEIILAVALTVLVLMQTKGSDLGGFLGGSGDSGSLRTRRGVEATIHKITVYLAALFFICTFFVFLAWGQAV
jgi:protein translocase SecG subunit